MVFTNRHCSGRHVLGFVDKDVTKSPGHHHSKDRVTLDQLYRRRQQVTEIEDATPALQLAIALDRLDERLG